MSAAIQLTRWRTADGVRLGLAFSNDAGILPVDEVIPGVMSIAALVGYCRGQHLDIAEWPRG